MSRPRPSSRSAPLALRLLAVPATAAVVLAGLWVTGGLISNDFRLAMALTAAWMGLAGLTALVIAARSRAFRWPVLAAYVVTAAVAGVYLGASVVADDVVDEQVATVAPQPPAMMAVAGEPARPAEPRNVRLRSGRFQPGAHAATGVATAIRLARGGRVLTLTDFEVDNGPDLRLYLVAGDARSEGEVQDYVDLGALKGNRGDQQYRLPPGLDLDRYSTAVVWCRAFSVLFARAPTRA
jgi:hypothetical protein